MYRNKQDGTDVLFEYTNVVRFQVLTAASMMFRVVFWVILPCKRLSTDVSEVRTASITHP
jgi:hypothetical protein